MAADLGFEPHLSILGIYVARWSRHNQSPWR